MTEGYRGTHSPKALYDAYRSLSVEMPDKQQVFFVDVREYRNYGLPESDYSCVAGVEEGYNRLHRAVVRHGRKAGAHRYQLTLGNGERLLVHTTDLLRVYIGKGSPDEIQMALRLAVEYKLVRPTLGALQSYCDKYIGLDCSGFTGVYYGPPYRGKRSTDYRTAGREVKELSELVPGCAIVWLRTNHLSIIDSVYRHYVVNDEQVAVECMVAEATAARMEVDDPNDGLNYSSYTILKEAKGWYVTRRVMRRKQLRETHPAVTIRDLG